MALPTTIASVGGAPGHGRVFKSSAGNFYAIRTIKGTSNQLIIYKSTDPTSSWSVVSGSAPALETGGHQCTGAVQHGDNIHIVTIGTSLILEYHRFNMSTEVFDAIDVQIANLTGMSTPGSNVLWCSIAYRVGATNKIVVAASGIPDTDMGAVYERVDFWHSADGSSWTGPVSLDVAAANKSEVQPQLVLGTNDKVHAIWSRSAIDHAQTVSAMSTTAARTIATDNSLSTIVSTSGNSDDAILGKGNVISYDDSGTQRIIIPYKDVNDAGRVLWSTEDGSDNISAFIIVQFSDGTTNDVFENGEVGILTAANGDSTAHVLWSGGAATGSDQDLYHDSSTDGGTTWGTDVEELNAVTINYISATVYQRGSSLVIAYVYDDGGVTRYNEITLTIPSMSTLSAGDFGSLVNSHVGPFEI